MEILPKCINGNRAVNICVSDECRHPNPFICGNCQCMQLHSNCINLEWANIKNRIEQSKKPNHPDFIQLSSAVEQTIQKSIKYLQKQLQYFNVWKTTFGMPINAINLFKSIQNNQEHKFIGKQVAQILKDTKTEKQIKIYNETTIKQQMKEVLKKMEQTQKMIREMYSVWDVPAEKLQQIKVIKISQTVIQNVPWLSLKIKQYYLDNMNKRLTNLTEKPTDLELKCNQIDISGSIHFNIISECTFEYHFSRCILIQFQGQLLINRLAHISIQFQIVNFKIISDLKQFNHDNMYLVAESLKNENLTLLKTLTLYQPYTLGYNSYDVNCQQLISSSLLSLPELQSVTIIARDIKSLDGFKSLGNKLKASKDQGWYNREEWQK